jgi:hypothetical protein
MNNLISDILALEKVILECPQVEMPVTHIQINGVYARSLFIPQGVMLTGKIHNTESIGILAQGTLRVCNGEEFHEITAPHVMIDKAGIKRIGYAVTDCTFITVHRTDKTDLAEIEEELTSMTFDEFEQKTKLLEVEK